MKVDNGKERRPGEQHVGIVHSIGRTAVIGPMGSSLNRAFIFNQMWVTNHCFILLPEKKTQQDSPVLYAFVTLWIAGPSHFTLTEETTRDGFQPRPIVNLAIPGWSQALHGIHQKFHTNFNVRIPFPNILTLQSHHL